MVENKQRNLKLPRIYFKLRKLTQKNKNICHLLKFFNGVLYSPYVKSIGATLLTTILSLEIKLTNFNNFSFGRLSSYLEIMHIIITIVIYIIFLCVIVTIDKVSQASEERYKYLKEINLQQGGINHHIGGKLCRINKNINDKVNYIPKKSDFDLLTYQDIANLICQAIYNIIKNATDKEDHQVTILHKFSEKNGKYHTSMIAFGNKSNTAPADYKIEYRPEYEPKYYHQKIFEQNDSKIHIIKNREEILGEFVINCNTRDDKITQYIAIPIYCEEKGIISLLQIDTEVEGHFGDTYEDIEEVYIKPLGPFFHQLLVNFNRECLVSGLVKKVNIYSKRRGV